MVIGYRLTVIDYFFVPLHPLCPPEGEIGVGTGACPYQY